MGFFRFVGANSARVASFRSQAGNKGDLFRSYNSIDDVPAIYRQDPRFTSLASDPAHGGEVTMGGMREAMAGLEAEALGSVRAIQRGPAQIEFYNVHGMPYDVKTPPSLQGVKFNANKVANSILGQLNKTFRNSITGQHEPIKVILDSIYLNSADNADLWQKLRSLSSAEQRKNIIELNTRTQ